MNRKPLIWLLLALTLAAYAVSIFISNRGESVWSTVSGVIMVVAAGVMFGRYLQERKADQSEQ
ncbi:hypothetical protein [Paenarthrobacter nitroguajacolicus]|uniref:hypothetical protein n=1 Tax=Paenarthrobacter nitroguajacolicus TaxID=211146 RepID=UPI0040542644